MEKTVPHFPGTVPLFTRIEPQCLSTIFLQVQRPSPAPTSVLVVTNGSNRLDRTLVGIPQPESATTSLTPRLPLVQSFAADSRTRTCPLASTASKLLLTRLAISCRISPRTAQISGSCLTS